jgi:putative endonuclease
MAGRTVHKEPAVYILTNQKNGTLYVGMTSSLTQRIYQHRNDLVTGFSQKYQTHRLVYYELHTNMEAAITREKQIKKWNRAWKMELITSFNPDWDDLYSGTL